jgi:hypothetical protein
MSDRPEPKKPGKKPKIIQVLINNNGLFGVLYDNGRVFFWNWTRLADPFDANKKGEGYWGELTYPKLR